MIKILKDVLIAAGDIDRYYEQAPVNLWRARRRSDTGTVFALIEEEKVLSSGQPRPADITIFVRDGVKWVSCEFVPRGISTFDKPRVFRGSSWQYYKIPQGTTLPAGLAIVRDGFNARIGATHYTLAPAEDMPLTQFKALLDNLAVLVMRATA